MILKQFAEIPIVKGYNRSCIYDLPRRNYDFIANDVVEKITSLIDVEKSIIMKTLDKEEKKWLKFLIEKEYFYFISKEFIDCFPKIDFKWDSPSTISNVIIDIGDASRLVDFSFLESFNCKHLLIRFYNIQQLEEIIIFYQNNLNYITLKSLEVILLNGEKFSISKLKQFIKTNPIEQIINIRIGHLLGHGDYFFPKFKIDINIFSESQDYNIYFNKKLYIDQNGNIKNGIESSESFGNINKNLSIKYLHNIVESQKFTEINTISKDKIEVCKECEFRYKCIDNKIKKKRKDDSYFFDLECSYNPYISKWKDEKDYVSLENCGVKIDVEDVIVDVEKINNINFQLWGAKNL